MKKLNRVRVGDEVAWEGGPNEFRNNRHGKILSINKKKGFAEIDDYRNSKKRRKVPLINLVKR